MNAWETLDLERSSLLPGRGLWIVLKSLVDTPDESIASITLDHNVEIEKLFALLKHLVGTKSYLFFAITLLTLRLTRGFWTGTLWPSMSTLPGLENPHDELKNRHGDGKQGHRGDQLF